MTALHNEPFTFRYPEGCNSTNIFNCPFCISQRWDSQYAKCPECLITLNSFSHINFYSTISDGTLPFPRCTRLLYMQPISESLYKDFRDGHLDLLFDANKTSNHFFVYNILSDSVTFCLSASRGHLVNVYLILLEAWAVFIYNYNFQLLAFLKISLSFDRLSQSHKVRFFCYYTLIIYSVLNWLRAVVWFTFRGRNNHISLTRWISNAPRSQGSFLFSLCL